MKKSLSNFVGMAAFAAMMGGVTTEGTFEAPEQIKFDTRSNYGLQPNSNGMYVPTKSQRVKSKQLKAQNKRQGRN